MKIDKINLDNDNYKRLPFKYNPAIFYNIPCNVSSELRYRVPYEKLLPSFAYEVSKTEGCNWTIPELHTYLIDGITVGGHTVRDEITVKNVGIAWDAVNSYASGNYEDVLTRNFICSMHSVLLRDLSDVRDLGTFRKTDVRIQGAPNWSSVPCGDLDTFFEKELNIVKGLGNRIEQAVILQLWLSYRQFFLDGNKRVARMMCNALLSQYRVGIFVIPADDILNFSEMLCEFYNTADATRIISHILNSCLITFDSDGYAIYP